MLSSNLNYPPPLSSADAIVSLNTKKPTPPASDHVPLRTRIPIPSPNAAAKVDRLAQRVATLGISSGTSTDIHSRPDTATFKSQPRNEQHQSPPPLPPKPARTARAFIEGDARAARAKGPANADLEYTRPEVIASPAEPRAPTRADSDASIIPHFDGSSDPVLDSGTIARQVQNYAANGMPSAATRRKCTMTKVFFLDYYLDLLTYLDQRKQRLAHFKEDAAVRQLTKDEYAKEWKYYCGKERAHLRKRRTRTTMASFHIIKQVGQGGYGQVYLARKKDTKELCALKKMRKELLHKLGEVQHILTERDILTRTNTPWLVKLLYAFQDLDHVYLAMEYVPGGDMRTLLNNSGVLREEHARFYVAEMFLAVSELHRLGYIHRDLKPENFLIDAGGHVKLTDFGLSRGALSSTVIESLRVKLERVKEMPFTYRSVAERKNIYQSLRREDMQAYSLVGSPDYMAPEVLVNNKTGYGLAVDYWSIGCILFECLAGYPPFTAPTTDDVWVNVYHWEKVLERPVYTGEDEEFNLTNTAWGLITNLITFPQSRIQSLQSAQSHPFFRPLLFTDLRTPNITPPFVPALSSETDTCYFDDFSDPSDMAMYKEVRERMEEMEKKGKEEGKGGQKEGKEAKGKGGIANGGELRTAFVGFTFKHKETKDWDGAAYTGRTMF